MARCLPLVVAALVAALVLVSPLLPVASGQLVVAEIPGGGRLGFFGKVGDMIIAKVGDSINLYDPATGSLLYALPAPYSAGEKVREAYYNGTHLAVVLDEHLAIVDLSENSPIYHPVKVSRLKGRYAGTYGSNMVLVRSNQILSVNPFTGESAVLCSVSGRIHSVWASGGAIAVIISSEDKYRLIVWNGSVVYNQSLPLLDRMEPEQALPISDRAVVVRYEKGYLSPKYAVILVRTDKGGYVELYRGEYYPTINWVNNTILIDLGLEVRAYTPDGDEIYRIKTRFHNAVIGDRYLAVGEPNGSIRLYKIDSGEPALNISLPELYGGLERYAIIGGFLAKGKIVLALGISSRGLAEGVDVIVVYSESGEIERVIGGPYAFLQAAFYGDDLVYVAYNYSDGKRRVVLPKHQKKLLADNWEELEKICIAGNYIVAIWDNPPYKILAYYDGGELPTRVWKIRPGNPEPRCAINGDGGWTAVYYGNSTMGVIAFSGEPFLYEFPLRVKPISISPGTGKGIVVLPNNTILVVYPSSGAIQKIPLTSSLPGAGGGFRVWRAIEAGRYIYADMTGKSGSMVGVLVDPSDGSIIKWRSLGKPPQPSLGVHALPVYKEGYIIDYNKTHTIVLKAESLKEVLAIKGAKPCSSQSLLYLFRGNETIVYTLDGKRVASIEKPLGPSWKVMLVSSYCQGRYYIEYDSVKGQSYVLIYDSKTGESIIIPTSTVLIHTLSTPSARNAAILLGANILVVGHPGETPPATSGGGAGPSNETTTTTTTTTTHPIGQTQTGAGETTTQGAAHTTGTTTAERGSTSTTAITTAIRQPPKNTKLVIAAIVAVIVVVAIVALSRR